MSEEIGDTPIEEEVAQEVVEQQETTVEKTMDDTIRETMDDITARGEGKDAELAKERIDKRKLRERSPDGKYTAKAVEAAEEPQPTEPAEQKEPTTVPPELQRLGLKKEEAEAFAKADQTVRDAFIRRSEEMHKGIEQFRQKAQFADQMAQAIQPYAQHLQSMGMHPIQAVQRLMAADNVLRSGTPEQKQAAALHVLQGYGIQIGEGAHPYVDQNLSGLQTDLQRMQNWILQKEQQEQQREQATLNSEIASFSADPANKHFEAVRSDMAGLLQAGIATNLKDAYERAIYANPTVRASVLAEQQAQSDAARKADSIQKAQEAKRASAINVQRRGTIVSKKPLGSMEETIRDKARELGLIS